MEAQGCEPLSLKAALPHAQVQRIPPQRQFTVLFLQALHRSEDPGSVTLVPLWREMSFVFLSLTSMCCPWDGGYG